MGKGFVSLTAAFFFSGCNSLFYYPTSINYDTPSNHGFEFKEIEIPTSGGEKLSAWHIHSRTKAPLGTVIHYHGNAENMTSHATFIYWLAQSGYDVYTFDYRGYGRSPGKVSRRSTLEDGQAALTYVASQAAPNDLFILGQSLGGAIATFSAANVNVPHLRAMIIDSSFGSYPGIASKKLSQFWRTLPFQWLGPILISSLGDPISEIEKIKIPLLFVHGDADSEVPISEGKLLFNAAKVEDKIFWTVPKGTHTSAFSMEDSQYKKDVLAYLCDKSSQSQKCRK